MTEVVPISAVTLDDVRRIVMQTLASIDQRDPMRDFLVAVDWSKRHQPVDPQVRAALGELEGLTGTVDEGDMTIAEYEAELQRIASDCAKSLSA